MNARNRRREEVLRELNTLFGDAGTKYRERSSSNFHPIVQRTDPFYQARRNTSLLTIMITLITLPVIICLGISVGLYIANEFALFHTVDLDRSSLSITPANLIAISTSSSLVQFDGNFLGINITSNASISRSLYACTVFESAGVNSATLSGSASDAKQPILLRNVTSNSKISCYQFILDNESKQINLDIRIADTHPINETGTVQYFAALNGTEIYETNVSLEIVPN